MVALSYVWENVYAYDKDFHIHMSRNPNRNWSIILQQAWSLCLLDRLGGSSLHLGTGQVSKSDYSEGKKDQSSSEPCRQYNKGHCPFGTSCHYEHECSYCLKFGHTILNCRKLMVDKDRAKQGKDHRSAGGNTQ